MRSASGSYAPVDEKPLESDAEMEFTRSEKKDKKAILPTPHPTPNTTRPPAIPKLTEIVVPMHI
jgi:hypothetical protein